MKKKIFIITGTSSGIGNKLTSMLLDRDENVIGIGRKNVFESEYYSHLSIDLGEVIPKNYFYDFFKKYFSEKKPDLFELFLINNAAELGQVTYLDNLEMEKLIQSFNVNLFSVCHITHDLLRYSLENEMKLIVLNITSGAANREIDGWGVYCSSKSALSMMTKVWEKEARIRNWNAEFRLFSPGVVDTPMQNLIRKQDRESFFDLDKFIGFKDDNKLENPENTATKILNELNYKWRDK